MRSSDNKRWPPFTSYTGEKYALDHIHPFQTDIIQAKTKDKQEKIYLCWVTFNCHCFTSQRPKVELETSPRIYRDGMGENRVFSQERYDLSKQLPEILKGKFRDQAKCHQLAENKFLIIEITDSNGKSLYYEIYFQIFKSDKRKNTVNIEIVSAYPRNLSSNKKPKKTGSMRIQIMAQRVISGKPLDMAPERTRKR